MGGSKSGVLLERILAVVHNLPVLGEAFTQIPANLNPTSTLWKASWPVLIAPARNWGKQLRLGCESANAWGKSGGLLVPHVWRATRKIPADDTKLA